jgi:parvulin-like peptidyl-prolyl isomerase
VDDLIAAGAGLERNYGFPPDSAKRRMLDDLVNRTLLEQGARALGYAGEPGYASAVARAELPYLTDALFRDESGGNPKVSDSEVRALYRQRGTETHARVMYIAARSAAEAALRDLRAGQEFAQLADRYSVPGSVPPGGDVGFLPAGALLDPLDDDLRTRPAGWVSPPVPGPGGAFIILQVLERRPREQPPFAADSAQLHDMLAQRKQRALAQRILDNLRTQYELRPVPGGAQFLFQKFTSLRAPSFMGQDATPTMPEFTPEEYAMPLVEWKGGRYTVHDAVDDLKTSSQRPMLSVLPQIQGFLESQALQRIAVQEAKRRGLQRQPDLSARLKGRETEWLINRLYESTIVPRAHVEEWQLRQVFDLHRAELKVVDEVQIRYVDTPDSALAARLAAPTPGGDLAARAAAMEAKTQAATVRPAQHSPRWAEYEDLFATMQRGLIAGPIPSASGWTVVELVDRKEHLPTWEQLDGSQQRNLAEEVLASEREKALTAFVDSLRHAMRPFETHYDRLAAVPWPLRKRALPGVGT